MMHPKHRWNQTSIRYKVLIWVVAILLLVGISIGVSIGALQAMILDYEALSVDNQKCYDVQKAIDTERTIFQDLIREPDQRNQTRFAKACVKTQQCIAALPMTYSDIGEDRFARTWNLRSGYYGYVDYRDKLLAMDTGAEGYTTELYRVVQMQESLSEYSLRLIQETMEYGNRHYAHQQEYLMLLPLLLIGLSVLALVFVFMILRLLTVRVVDPMVLLAEESRCIARNDFSRPDLKAQTQDEVGELMLSFNRMKHATADYIATREQLHREAVEKLEMEKNMEHIRLEMLKSQVNPHFLFNTLNMISCMARLEDAETTDKMIVALGSVFRYNLRTKEQEVYLEQELDALDDYLYIQQMRYDSRITYKKDIRVDTYTVRIPSFTLQPIVENALAHGMKSKEEGGRILLKIWQEGNMVTISVMDNGQGMNMEEKEALHQKILSSEKTGRSIGLGNLYRRIAKLYPDGELKVHSKEGCGTIVQLKIPQKEGRNHEV